ncbi:TPA: class I SAM-dependent methyltransferase [Candidatus Micrarchaeota archaeon]|nr:class I SAM-dependent methyltransferase [Candidatus Micrarchaeota archaeon]
MTRVKPKLIVHFGAGDWIPRKHYPPIRANETHLVYDPDPELPKKYAEFKDSQVGKLPLTLIPRGAQNTGLRRDSVDVIHIHNVFSAPSARSVREDLLKEAERILKPGGIIYMLHWNTPEYMPKEELLQMANMRGLKIEFPFSLNKTELRELNKSELDSLREISEFPKLLAKLVTPGAYLAKLTKKQG